MKNRNIVIGLLGLAVIISVIYISSQRDNTPKITPSPTPSIEEKIKGTFNLDIPENADRAELNPQVDEDIYGLATRQKSSTGTNYSVLADLPTLESGQFYQAWLENSDGSEVVSMGTLSEKKGGWLLDYQSRKNLDDFNHVLVTRETKLDATPETTLLSGNF